MDDFAHPLCLRVQGGVLKDIAHEGGDLVVLHPNTAHLMADLPNVNAPAAQELALALDDVLVEDVHEPVIRTGGGVGAMMR